MIRYLILTTLWLAVLPGLVVSTPFLIFGLFTLIATPFFVFYVFLFLLFCRFNKKFHQKIRDDDVPKLLLIRLLPFFLPLFYILILASIGFC